MAQKVYAVTLHVTAGNLGTVLSALEGSSTLVSVVPTQKVIQDPPSTAKPKGTRWANGKHNKGITGDKLAMETLSSSNRPFSMSEIGNAFVNRGFARNSASPIISILVKSGKVRALGGGQFCLPGTTVNYGAGQ